MLNIRWLSIASVLLFGVAAMAEVPPEYRDMQLSPLRLESLLGEDIRNGVRPLHIQHNYGQKDVEPGEYWLGIQVFPVVTTIHGQPDAPKKPGLLVVAVMPESPAAKAGILRHDVLLRAGEKQLFRLGGLIRAIEAVKDGAMKIELIRDGKEKTVEATPEKRPADAQRNPIPIPNDSDRETMEKWFGRMLPDGEAGGARPPLRFRVIHPGAILPRGVFSSVPLPPNMSIMVRKQGDQPAQITVNRGDEKWETTEKGLDALPADVRPHVERMLGRGPLGIVGDLPTFNFAPKMVSPDSDAARPPTGSAAWEGRFERRLDEMNRRMDRLLDAMERSLGSRTHHNIPEESPEN